MTHLPKNPYCNACNRAKMFKATARSGNTDPIDKPKRWGDKVTADTMFATNDKSAGINAARYAMVIYDLYSGWLEFSAQAKKSAAKAKQALKRFDPTSRIKSFYCDNAPELIQAARDLGYSNPTSTPYRSTSNAVAERQNRVVLEGTRTVLSQSGCPTYWWPYAGHHFCFSRNITPHPITNVSPFKKRYPKRKDFDGLRLPFGCAVDFRPPDHVLK